MGVSISKYSDLTTNELLVRFSSKEVICPNNPYWNQLLAFNIKAPKTSEEQLTFECSIETHLHQLLANNQESGNLGALVQIFVTRATELLTSPTTDNTLLAWQTYNALFVIRIVLKYLIETIPEFQLILHMDVQQMLDSRTVRNHASGEEEQVHSPDCEEKKETVETPPIPPDGSPPDEEVKDAVVQLSSKVNMNESRSVVLIDALFGIIINVPITDNTYYLHLDCINTILILMSVRLMSYFQMRQSECDSSPIFRILFQGRYSIHAPLLVKTLLNNFTAMYTAPDNMFGFNESGGSLVLGLASGIWNMLTLAKTNKQSIYTVPPADNQQLKERLIKEHPVANQSCLLLLALTNHCMNSDNLYRRALLDCQHTSDASTPSSKDTTPNNSVPMTPPRIDMNTVHNALCATAGCEHTTLLLYLLMHSCKAYKKHVCSVANIETLILPMLQSLYKATDSTSHHIYMSLIVLLILTEDEALIKNVHQIMLKNLTWYTERTISEISLGGMMVLIIIRTVQYNILKVRDKYLHTNCLAVLANMSCEFRNLHPYVAQRLISLFETLCKRRAKVVNGLQPEAGAEENLNLESTNGEKVELWEHMEVLEDVLRMILEIINSCLTHQLPSNINLVYALLYKRDVFNACKNDESLSHVLQNIDMVIGYFTSRLSRTQKGAWSDLSVTEVLQSLKKGAEQWTSDRLRKFSDLKFRYVEEDKPEEFFTPYVWSLVNDCGSVFLG